MFSRNKWAQLFEDVVRAIPSALGESMDAKRERVANYAGISRASLYNILDGKPTKLIPLDGWLRICEMLGQGDRAAMESHIQKLLQPLGVKLERNGEDKEWGDVR